MLAASLLGHYVPEAKATAGQGHSGTLCHLSAVAPTRVAFSASPRARPCAPPLGTHQASVQHLAEVDLVRCLCDISSPVSIHTGRIKPRRGVQGAPGARTVDLRRHARRPFGDVTSPSPLQYVDVQIATPCRPTPGTTTMRHHATQDTQTRILDKIRGLLC